jgi:outer membrane protein assembly factor BamB
MKSKTLLVISTLLLLSFFISSCSSAIYASTGWHGLTASTDTAYLAAGSQIHAVDLNTGNEKWLFPSKVDSKISFYANPILTPDGQLLVAGYNHILYSLDPASGTEKWSFTGSGNRLIGSPLVTQDMIYQPSTDGNIYALDLKLTKVWEATTGGPLWSQPATAPGCNCIYVASMDHMVYSFDAPTGKQLWKSQDLEGALVGTPAVSSDGVLFIGTFNKEMIALDATNGTVKWRKPTLDWVWSGPALANNVLYFGDLAGNFYAMNAVDGTTLWHIQPSNAIVDTPEVVGDKIYFTTEADKMYIVSTAGAIILSPAIGGIIYSSPVIVGDTILVAPTGIPTTLLVATNMDGTQKWTYPPAK